jgi:glycosyltransferase involved in cell wall biosynthesis
MKFSVLLPTRNGGPYLKNCINSILGQGFEDLELIISDNANTDNTAEIIENYKSDSRVKILKLDTPINVTDNWNNALFSATGDYVMMMGDDDLLLSGYFDRMSAIIEEYAEPDCILHNGYSYVAPNSIGKNISSFYSRQHFNFGSDLREIGVMSMEQRTSIVRDMFEFKVRIPLNMQTTLVKRSVLPRFYPPFPDHYALNSLLLTAGKWVFTPEKLLVVGVSPKSFGHYFYSSKHKSGLAYLGVDPKFPGMLPGSDLTNGMHMWLNLLKDNLNNYLSDTEVNRGGYVRRQVFSWYMQRKFGALSATEFLMNFKLLSVGDWLGVCATILDVASWNKLRTMLSASFKSKAEMQWNSLQKLPEKIVDIAQFAKWIETEASSEQKGVENY